MTAIKFKQHLTLNIKSDRLQTYLERLIVLKGNSFFTVGYVTATDSPITVLMLRVTPQYLQK